MIANKGHEVKGILSSTIANQSTDSLKSLCGQLSDGYFRFLSYTETGLSFFFGLVSLFLSLGPRMFFCFVFFRLRVSTKGFYLQICQMRNVNNSK